MQKGVFAALTCAALSGLSFMTSVSRAAFTDTFNGSSSDQYFAGGFWSTGSYVAGDGSVISDPVGGPLTLSYPQTTSQGGPYMDGTVSEEFNFFEHPLMLTVTGPNLIPGTDHSAANADTYMGVGGNVSFRDDNGANTVVLGLNSQNVPILVIRDSTGHSIYSYSLFAPPNTTFFPQGSDVSDIDVTSMFFYVDGTHASSGHLYVNFGETWTNTQTDATGSYTMENRLGLNSPFDVGTFPGVTVTGLSAGYPNGAAPSLEVLNAVTNLNGNEAVSFTQITDAVPEPVSGGLLVVGLGLLAGWRRRV
jgi:MYXO-CTERM domain-containing protein